MSNHFSRFGAGVLLSGALLLVSGMRAQSAPSLDLDPAGASPGTGEARPRVFLPAGAEPRIGHAKPLRVDVDLVLVPVSVTDPMNRTVLGLQKQDFKVYEDNEEQQIQYFSAEEAPISVGLLLDTSKSMANKFVVERAAAEEFFKNANPQDDYFVITFADRPQLLTRSISPSRECGQPATSAGRS